MSDWVPAGSVPYGMTTETMEASFQNHGFISDSEQAVFSTTPYKGEVERNPKRCIANGNTCKGWKCNDTNYCVGHLKSQAKEDDVAEVSHDG